MKERKQFNHQQFKENFGEDDKIPKIGEFKPELLKMDQQRILNKYRVSFKKKEELKKKPWRNKEGGLY